MSKHFDSRSMPVEEAIQWAVSDLLLARKGRPTSALMNIQSLTAMSMSLCCANTDRVRWSDGCVSIWTPAGYLDVRPDIQQPAATAVLFDSEGKPIADITLCA